MADLIATNDNSFELDQVAGALPGAGKWTARTPSKVNYESGEMISSEPVTAIPSATAFANDQLGFALDELLRKGRDIWVKHHMFEYGENDEMVRTVYYHANLPSHPGAEEIAAINEGLVKMGVDLSHVSYNLNPDSQPYISIRAESFEEHMAPALEGSGRHKATPIAF